MNPSALAKGCATGVCVGAIIVGTWTMCATTRQDVACPRCRAPKSVFGHETSGFCAKCYADDEAKDAAEKAERERAEHDRRINGCPSCRGNGGWSQCSRCNGTGRKSQDIARGGKVE